MQRAIATAGPGAGGLTRRPDSFFQPFSQTGLIRWPLRSGASVSLTVQRADKQAGPPFSEAHWIPPCTSAAIDAATPSAYVSLSRRKMSRAPEPDLQKGEPSYILLSTRLLMEGAGGNALPRVPQL